MFGQISYCSSSTNEQQLQHFKALKRNIPSNVFRSNETKYLPVRFHAVADAEGEGRVNLDNILDQMCELNANFAEQNIQFYMKDGMVNEINDNTIFTNPASAAGTSKMVTRKNAAGKNAINIFITEEASTGGEGTTLGYYDFNADLIVLKKSVLQSSRDRKFVCGHEMGHFFSLSHTFRGWENAPWNGEVVTQFSPTGGILNELVDGTNCEDAGDMICDTPPDYNLGFGWDGCRDYDGGAKDPNGVLLDPDESNFMGYFIGCEAYFFSEEQKEIITQDYESPRRSYLRVGYVPNSEEITETPVLQSPADDVTTTYFNGVELSWTEVANATDYLVEVSRGLLRTYYRVSGTKLFLTDLEADKIYRWKVRPFNELSTCSTYSQVFSFKTGDLTSSINDLKDKEYDVSIFPNPVHNNIINITFGEELRGNFDVTLMDISGKTYYKENVKARNYTIENVNLKSGFYILTLRQEETIISKKIVVND
jgi:hypothetical protein